MVPRKGPRSRFALLGLVAAASLLAACGPPPPPASDPSFRPIEKTKTVVFADETALAEFEAPADEVYRLSEGDKITLTVWGRPELSGRKVVGPDGRISLPIGGSAKVSLLTREEAGRAVAELLRPLYVDPSVAVEVEEYVGNKITVLGRVGNPGIIRFDEVPTLLDLLSRAGALPLLDKKATLSRCAIFRGRDRILWVDLKTLLAKGRLAMNIRLRRGDLVYIPDSDDTVVYVLGDVQRPGAYRFAPDMSLLDALAQAGGPTEDADVKQMRLVRPSTRLERLVPFADVLDPKGAANIGLEEGDILYVPRRGLRKFGYVMQQVTPFLNLIVFGKAIAGL